jgi:Tfp pilus assembly protein PilN
MGGSRITNSLASQLNLTGPDAEALKRAGHYDGQLSTDDRVRTLVYDEVRPLLAEISSSLDFFQAQVEGRALDRVLLTGGGALTKGLQLGLAGAIGNASLTIADPFARLTMSPELVFTDRQRYEASTQALTPIGLALWGAEPALRRVNLLPPEIAIARRRRTAIRVSAVALTALAVALGGTVYLRDRQVDRANQAVTQIEQSNAVLKDRVTSLSGATVLQSEVQRRRALAETALTGDIAFVPLLQEISAGLPAHDWVSSITLEVTPGGPSATTGGYGTFQLAMSGLDGHESVAEWLRAAAQIPDLGNVWVGSSATSPSGLDTFSSTGDLTKSAASSRAEKLPGAR